MDNLRTYGNWAGNPKGVKEDPSRCIEGVYHGLFSRGSQCGRKRGHGPGGEYCKQHSPDEIARKNRLRTEKFEFQDAQAKQKWKDTLVGRWLREHNPTQYEQIARNTET